MFTLAKELGMNMITCPFLDKCSRMRFLENWLRFETQERFLSTICIHLLSLGSGETNLPIISSRLKKVIQIIYYVLIYPGYDSYFMK